METAASLIYLGLAAIYMLVITLDRSRRHSPRWRMGAVAIWIGVFVALTFLADRMGLRLP